MRAAGFALTTVLLVAACGGGSRSDQIPTGTFVGSTATDQAITLVVGDKVTVNRHAARLIKRGVIEVRDGEARATITCKVLDHKQEQLRCTFRMAPPGGAAPTTEVIDLMLL